MHKNAVDQERVYRILYGELSGSREDYVLDREQRFAYAFLRLTEIVAGRVIPIDEARLDASENKLDYLRDAENVYSDSFALEYRWYRREMGFFLLLTLAGTIISSAIPSAAGYITSSLIPNREETRAFMMAVSLLLGILAGLMVNITVNRTKVRIQTKTGYGMLSAMMGRIMCMDSAEEKRLSGRIIALLMPFIGAVETIAGSLLSGFVFLLQSLMVLSTTISMRTWNTRVILLLAVGEIVPVIWTFDPP